MAVAARSVALLALLVCLVPGCELAASSPPMPDAGWYARMLGSAPNLALVVHVGALVRDPYYGPLAREAFEHHRRGPGSLVELLAACDEVDFVAAVEHDARRRDVPAVLVLHQTSGVDPARLVDDGGRAYFGAGHTLVSGAVEYPDANDPAIRLYALPGGTWIVAHGGAVERARAQLSASASAPPRFDLEPGSLVSASVRRSALDAGTLGRRELSAFDQAVVAIDPGPSGHFVTRVWLTSEEAAAQLQDQMLEAMTPDARCESTCLLVHALLLQLIDVKRSGREVEMHLHVPEPVMRSLARRARQELPGEESL